MENMSVADIKVMESFVFRDSTSFIVEASTCRTILVQLELALSGELDVIVVRGSTGGRAVGLPGRNELIVGAQELVDVLACLERWTDDYSHLKASIRSLYTQHVKSTLH